MKRSHLVKVVFIELTDEASKVRMLEHAWKNRLGKLVHILMKHSQIRSKPMEALDGTHFYHERISSRVPRYDLLKRLILQHSYGE